MRSYVHVPKTLRKKLDYKCKKCIFLCYRIDEQFGYLLWDPGPRTMVRNSDVVFNENKMHKKPIKEVDVRKVAFHNVVPFVSIVEHNFSTDVDASACAQPHKNVVGQHDDAQ